MAASKASGPRQAMILAAGEGYRLRPLTDRRPKVLVPVANVPAVTGTIHRLRRIGVERIVANTFHLADRLEEFLEPEGVLISREERLLGTGGGPGKARDLLGYEPFILINGDILTDIDLIAFWEHHLKSGNIATLAVHDYPEYNTVAVDGDGRLAGVGDRLPGGADKVARRVAFTGIHALNPQIFDYLPRDKRASIIDIYLRIVSDGGAVGACCFAGHYWADIGTPAGYRRAHLDLAAGRFDPLEVLGRPARLPDVGPGTALEGEVLLAGATAVGANCRIGKGAVLADTILWDGVTVAAGVRLAGCIVGDGAIVTESAEGAVLT